MSMPRYVVKRVGDQYVTVRVDWAWRLRQPSVRVGAGIATTLLAFLMRGPIRWVAGLLGIGLIATAWSCQEGMCGSSGRRDKVAKLRRGPTFQHERPSQTSHQKPEDDIDEAVMESFPASDPMGSRAG